MTPAQRWRERRPQCGDRGRSPRLAALSRCRRLDRAEASGAFDRRAGRASRAGRRPLRVCPCCSRWDSGRREVPASRGRHVRHPCAARRVPGSHLYGPPIPRRGSRQVRYLLQEVAGLGSMATHSPHRRAIRRHSRGAGVLSHAAQLSLARCGEVASRRAPSSETGSHRRSACSCATPTPCARTAAGGHPRPAVLPVVLVRWLGAGQRW